MLETILALIVLALVLSVPAIFYLCLRFLRDSQKEFLTHLSDLEKKIKAENLQEYDQSVGKGSPNGVTAKGSESLLIPIEELPNMPQFVGGRVGTKNAETD